MSIHAAGLLLGRQVPPLRCSRVHDPMLLAVRNEAQYGVPLPRTSLVVVVVI